jgi:hypothetical protein
MVGAALLGAALMILVDTNDEMEVFNERRNSYDRK